MGSAEQYYSEKDCLFISHTFDYHFSVITCCLRELLMSPANILSSWEGRDFTSGPPSGYFNVTADAFSHSLSPSHVRMPRNK